MLLLVTGASGVGKTSVRKLLDPHLRPQVECAELWELSPNPPLQDLEWRQRTTELAVKCAAQLQRDGRHLLLCGDPIAPVEAAAAPSAAELQAVAFCLLDASPQAQAARLCGRADAPALLPHHQAYAGWMRQQAADPLCRLEVVSARGWDAMRWDRIAALAPEWAVHTIDTIDLDPSAAAAEVRSWIAEVLAGRAPTLDPSLA